MALTNQQVLDKLLDIRDNYLISGVLMQKNITTDEGSSIFYRSLDDLESYIQVYQAKVDAESASFNRRGYLYA